MFKCDKFGFYASFFCFLFSLVHYDKVSSFGTLSLRPHLSPIHVTNKYQRLLLQVSDDSNDELDYDDDKDAEKDEVSSDWLTAEFTLRTAPSEPSPDLDPETVALTCARALQWVDYPTENAGLKRCYEFFMWECRKLVTARRGGDTIEAFVKHGLLSPALQPFMGARRVDIGNVTITPAKPPLRGEMASFGVVIQSAPIFAVQHMSGMGRDGVASAPPETHMVMRLEKQRRPPMQGCWLVREMLDVRHAFAGDMGNVHVGG